MLLYWMLGGFWLVELIVALSLFTLSYSVVIWFYTPKDPPPPAEGHKDIPGNTFPLVRGLKYGVIYHLGSLAFGSFIIAVIRLLQFILSALARTAEQGDPQTNQLIRCVECCLQCVLKCFEKTIRFINKNAYIDIAIKSSSFCSACKNVAANLVQHGAKFAVLEGVSAMISQIGVALITCAGVFVAFMMVKLPMYQNIEGASGTGLESPYAVVAFAGLVAFLVGHVFMSVFDQVSDTLLYCFITSMGDGKAQLYAPESLAMLMNDEHHSGCC